MDIQQRIEQWEKMTREAPDGMAWFSLGNAYKEAGRDRDAANALRRAIELDGQMSRAYQLLGQVLLNLGQRDEAADVLMRGYRIAAQRGDVMPQRAMGSLLEAKLGRQPPAVQTPSAPTVQAGDAGTIIDRRTGQPQPRLPDPPMRGPVSRFIYDHFGQETWRQWIAMGTKVINELRLDFSNEAHQKIYEQQMLEWLGVSEEEIAQHARKSS